MIFIIMEHINGYIYLLIDNRNGKKYIGKHVGTDKNYFTGGIIPNKIAQKHGKDVFSKIILENNITDNDELSLKEIFYIEKYDTFNNGYNLSKGGDGGNSWTLKKTKDELVKISNIKKEKNLGRKFSEETLKKMSIAKKGKPLTEEHKKNISKSQSGVNHPWYGRKHSMETKLKISQTRKGTKNENHSNYMKKNNPQSLSVSINGVIFDSIQQASDMLKISRHVLKKRLNSDNFPFWKKN
jgi:group I intron endonuclease